MRPWRGDLLTFALLLLLPALAIHHLAGGEALYAVAMAAFACCISALTFWLYHADKTFARQGAWRTPENILHFAELAGGWPGAFLAQRRLRHKSAKASFLAIFWLIVLVHQFAAANVVFAGRPWRLLKRFTIDQVPAQVDAVQRK